VVAHYLGVPREDWGRFDGWTDAIVAANAQDPSAAPADAVAELMGYFAELIEWRRANPEDDTVSHLVAAGQGDDPGGILRILAFTFTMVAGGNDTTTGLLGGSVPLLEQRPDQRARALQDLPAAIEELLRLTSPVQGLARTTTRDVEIDGVTIPAGRKVLMAYGAANRDDRAYGPTAEDLDVTRNPRHILTFSHGAHHCLGAAAARMVGRVALREFLTRIPDFEVDHERITWAPGNYVRRPLSVPLTVLDRGRA
jgi:cytochrome P450